MSTTAASDVVIIGGGVAGRSAGIFTARHGLSTVILSAGGSLLERNAHLENYPGFPAGINARVFLDLVKEQAERSGCEFHAETVTRVTKDDGFQIETESGNAWQSEYVICATKNDVSYLQSIQGLEFIDRGKTFAACRDGGRTQVDGLYVAGRLAEKPHQTIVCAGHGAEVAVAVLEDDDRAFYHDWVTPDEYFTGRDRDVPPGCEELSEEERTHRESASLRVLREQLAEAEPTPPVQHPSVEADD